MQVKKRNRFVEFFKRFGLYVVAGALVFAIALTFMITALVNKDNTIDVDGPTSAATLPMNNLEILKDFSSTSLQENPTLNEWAAHLAIDMTSKDSDYRVFAVMDGEVASVYYDYLEGNTVVIDHGNGLVSYYSSLGGDVLVKKGDKVKSGDQIGNAGKTAAGELHFENEHLHFCMTQDNSKVDPNNYLDLENK